MRSQGQPPSRDPTKSTCRTLINPTSSAPKTTNHLDNIFNFIILTSNHPIININTFGFNATMHQFPVVFFQKENLTLPHLPHLSNQIYLPNSLTLLHAKYPHPLRC